MHPRRLLMPLSLLYALGQRIDRARKTGRRYESALPVISVGNLSVGGTGKTPLVLHLTERLAGEWPLLLLSRGYGRADSAERFWRAGDPLPDPALFGDEPALMARALSVHGDGALAVAPDRGALLRRIEGSVGGSVVLLDDGFQHYSLARDLDLVIVDERTARHPYPVPAGALREPPAALRRARVILATSDAACELAGRWKEPDAEVFRMRQESAGILRWEDEAPYDGEPGLAVCGIARPERFLGSLESLGARVVSQLIYSDHHRYGLTDLERIRGEMREHGARVVLTTAKDAVKLARYPELRDTLVVVHLRVAIEGEERLLAILRETITNKLESRNE